MNGWFPVAGPLGRWFLILVGFKFGESTHP